MTAAYFLKKNIQNIKPMANLSTLILIVLLNFLFSSVTFSADFIGSQACVSCHERAIQDWQGSHHEMSMKHASQDSVLGDFNNVTFTTNNDSTATKILFFKREQQYWVNIKGPDGKLHDYQIKYTFGVTPLQQYMVEFDDGRVQLIPFAWDSRSKENGGQRWFNLYPNMTKKHQEFFWTNTGQNWNYMCADCHSTNVKKNYELSSNSYQTTFSEVNVACESCHGAASEHIKWTKNKNKSINNFGFNRNLSSSVKHWQHDKNKTTLVPTNVTSSQQVLTCAQCHSRRTQISDKAHITVNNEGNTFGERYLLDLVSSENYYPDGQVYNENFVYGSFLQSKMYRKGVVCSDCHNPHTAKLKLPVETLCLQCHQAESYASTKHHNHVENSTGAQCVNCHMPQTTYMGIDARRDHGFHIPRPDLAQQLGTPDTCLSCHKDKDSNWSLNKVNTWFPNTEQRLETKKQKDYAAVFSASTMSLSNSQWQSVASELSRISQTTSYAPIIRASALAKMATFSNTNTLIAISRALKSENEFIRLGAINALQGTGAQEIKAQKWRLLSPLLTDDILTVRTSAAFALTSIWQELTQKQQLQLTPTLNEYLMSQDFNNDRSFAHTNKGIVYSYQGKFEQAIQSFNQGIAIEPYFAPAYINLSQVHRLLKQNKQTIITLKQGVNANPDDSQLLFELGMAYIREKDKLTATKYLQQATKLAPQNSHYYYLLGLSAEENNKTAAYKALGQAYEISNNPQHLYALCEMQVRHRSFQAKQCIQILKKVAPSNVINQLTKQLNMNNK